MVVVQAISAAAFAAEVPACENHQDCKDQGRHRSQIKSFNPLAARESLHIYLAEVERREAAGGLLAGSGAGGAERDPGEKQRVQAAVVARREHHTTIIRSLLLDQRHLQKLVLQVRQRSK